MSFNIWHDRDWGARKSLVVDVIREADPDIVGLQEALVWQLRYLTLEIPEYGFIAAGRDDGAEEGESAGILYRKDRFGVLTSDTFWFSNEPDTPGSTPGVDWGSPTYPRIVTWVRLLDSKSKRTLYHFNLHLQHDAGDDPELARARSVELLQKRIANLRESDPVIVTGDFNATRKETSIRLMTDATLIGDCGSDNQFECQGHRIATPLVDAFGSYPPGSDEGTRCFRSEDRGRRIDYIFVSKEATIQAVASGKKIGDQCPSDHHFVSATVSF